MKRRQRFEDFIVKVDLLADLDPYERSKLCDVLQPAVYKDGEYVIRQVQELINIREKLGQLSISSKPEKPSLQRSKMVDSLIIF